MPKSRVRINLTGKTAETKPQSRVRINLTGKRDK